MEKKPVLFLAGPHASGKTHAANLLEEQGYVSVDLGPLIRRFHEESGSNKNLGEWVSEQEEVYGKSFTDKILLDHTKTILEKNEQAKGIVIIGSRSAKNIEFMRDGLGKSESRIIYFEAHPSLLKERFENREGKALSDNEFQYLLDKDKNMGLEDIKEIADVKLLNNGSIDEFEEEFMRTMSTLDIEISSVKNRGIDGPKR